jgi:N-acetylmuramoyl-L-alanine amidase
MTIKGDFIVGLPIQKLKHVGAPQTPRLLVIHYSVTNTVSEAVTALNGASPPLGYHILIAKDGKAFQTRKFTEHAAHPGRSNWKPEGGLTMGSSLQRGSIGICMMNKGFAGDPGVPKKNAKLIYNPDDPSMQQWEVYPAAQIKACMDIAREILGAYPITEVVGHHDIAINGKFDPGPLFDFGPLNALVPSSRPLGFETKVKSGPLSVRRLPKASATEVAALPAGAKVHIRSVVYTGTKADSLDPSTTKNKRYLTRWASVDIDGSDKHAGFVNMKFLTKTPLSPALAAKL